MPLISWICFTVTQNSGNKLEYAHLCWWSIKCFSGSFSQDAEIWSLLLVPVRTLAASFWTNCKCWICSWLISEVITELQEFTLEKINGQLQFLGHKQINEISFWIIEKKTTQTVLKWRNFITYQEGPDGNWTELVLTTSSVISLIQEAFFLERTPAHLEVNIKCFVISKKIVFIYTECWTITEFPTALVNIVNLLSWSRVFRSMTWPHRSCARHLRSRREASQIASPWWWEATALSMKKSGWLRLMAPRACSLSARTDW